MLDVGSWILDPPNWMEECGPGVAKVPPTGRVIRILGSSHILHILQYGASAAPMQPYAAPVQPYAAPVQPNAAPAQPYAVPAQPNQVPKGPAAVGIAYRSAAPRQR